MNKQHGLSPWLAGLLALALLFWYTSCSQRSLPAPETVAAADGKPAQAGAAGALPDLPQSAKGASDLIDQPDISLAPSQAYETSGDSVWGDDGSVLLLPKANSVGFIIFRVGELLPADRLLGFSVEAVTQKSAPEDPDSEYYFMFANYAKGLWEVQGPQDASGQLPYDFHLSFPVLSPDAALYVAVVVPAGQAVRLYEVIAHLDLSGRGVDHLNAVVPPADCTGVDIAIPLEARDGADAIDYAYTGPANLRSEPPGLQLVSSADLVNGTSRPLVRFEQPGEYDVYLDGSIPALTGLLGHIHVWQAQLPVYSLHLDPAKVQYLTDNPWDNTLQDGSINIDGVQFPAAGLRFRGDSARWLWKKNWKVKLPQGVEYTDHAWGYARDELNLNAECVDPTIMREKLSYDLMQDMGLLSPRARFIHLRLNDVFQGLYVDVEEPDKRFLANHGVEKGGAIYKPVWCIMDVQGDGSPGAYVGPFDKKTRSAEPYDDLAQLIWDLNNVWQPGNCATEFKAAFDEDRFLKYMVANSLVSDGDQLGKNYVLYHEDVLSDQWMVIPWDYDLTWGHHYTSQFGLFCEPMFYDTPLDMGGYQSTYAGWRGVNNLLDRYVYDPMLFSEFKSQLGLDMETYFKPQEMLARIDQYYGLVAEDAHADSQRWIFGTYEERVQELRDYVTQRRSFLTAQLGL